MYDDGGYYSYKNCDFYDLTATQSAHSYGSGTTVTGETCVPMVSSRNICMKFEGKKNLPNSYLSFTEELLTKPARTIRTGEKLKKNISEKKIFQYFFSLQLVRH